MKKYLATKMATKGKDHEGNNESIVCKGKQKKR